MYVYYMQNLHRSGALFFRTLFAYRCDWRCRYTFLQWHTTTWLLRSKISFGMQTFNVTLLYNKNQQQKIYNFMLISVCSITFNESTNAKSRYICWECVAEKNACFSYSILCVSSAPKPYTHFGHTKQACLLFDVTFFCVGFEWRMPSGDNSIELNNEPNYGNCGCVKRWHVKHRHKIEIFWLSCII